MLRACPFLAGAGRSTGGTEAEGRVRVGRMGLGGCVRVHVGVGWRGDGGAVACGVVGVP